MKASVKTITNYEYKKLFLPGLSRQIMQNNSRLQIYRIEHYLRNIVIPVVPYRTSFNFLIFLKKGRIVQLLETTVQHLEVNSILLIKQGSITATLEISPDATGYFMVYENEIIQSISLRKNLLNFFFTAPLVQLPPLADKWLSTLFQLIEEELDSENDTMDICISLFQSALTKVIRHGKKTKMALSRSLEITFLFRELVQKHHLSNRDVRFYARKLNISENYLNKCVKEATGKPPKQWINEMNILHSQILLQDFTRDVAGIAFELNFQSANYFTRLFRKVTGQTPSEFRRQMGSKQV